ncbi:hypothetical protein [Pseudomonas sp. CGJS7]|uniref:hypothetical protein n=1 Tax=Pseudomonas sp. CGJS7 TaxID=3109348 RepID=UPI00300AFAEC
MPLATLEHRYGPAPADLAALLRLRETGDSNFAETLADVGYRLIDPDDAPTLLDPASYMSPQELADPDIAANIRAIDGVCEFVSFFVEDDQSNLFGYWHGPGHAALVDAPIVKFDNEGQFSLLQGRGLVEALIGDRVFDDDEAFAGYAADLRAFGIEFAARSWEQLPEPPASSDPAQLHTALYERFRANPSDAN